MEHIGTNNVKYKLSLNTIFIHRLSVCCIKILPINRNTWLNLRLGSPTQQWLCFLSRHIIWRPMVTVRNHIWHWKKLDYARNVMAQVQNLDFAFRRNRRVHLNGQGRQYSRLLAAEVCASAVVMLDTPCSEVVWRVLATHSIRQFPPHFPNPCVAVCHHISTGIYDRWA
jgi:hypothetical protein